MWLPVTTGGSLLLRPARRMKPLPILSIVTVMPASRAQPVTRSRPCLSRSVSVRRHTPPLGVAPILANSINEPHSRSPSMRSSASLPLVFMSIVALLTSNRARRQFLRALGHRLEVGAERRALDVAARTLHGAQVAIGPHQLALAHRVRRQALDLASLEDVEVAFRELRLHRDRLRRAG